jgi:DNA invertase Pin-like site-specific DNA recombinase
MKTVINAAAAYERALIRARTRAALQASCACSRKFGACARTSRSGKPFALTQVARLARKAIEATSAVAEPLVGSARN